MGSTSLRTQTRRLADLENISSQGDVTVVAAFLLVDAYTYLGYNTITADQFLSLEDTMFDILLFNPHTVTVSLAIKFVNKGLNSGSLIWFAYFFYRIHQNQVDVYAEVSAKRYSRRHIPGGIRAVRQRWVKSDKKKSG